MDLHVVLDLKDAPAGTALVIPVYKGEEPDGIPHLSDEQRNTVRRAVERGARVSRPFELTLVYGSGDQPDVLLVGAGEAEAADPLTLRDIAAAASRHLTGRGYVSVAFVDRGHCSAWQAGYAFIDGAVAGSYDVGLKKTGEREDRQLDTVIVVAADGRKDEVAAGAQVGHIVGESRDVARDLVNCPPNEINPSSLAQRAQELAGQHGLTCEILTEETMRELGMGSLLGVASGSSQPPRVIVLRYGDENAGVKLAFVGKGITFDSGGLSLKTAEGMETMKSDMAGGAAVIAGMAAIARLAPEGISVTGYVGATENMPGGSAMRPGDILRAMNGKTIEVLNTDAEGRLVLADVLAYAVQQGATHLVDLATLTGAAMVSLGDAASLATGKPSEWVNRVVEAADHGLDRSWPMPQYAEYRRAMDSHVADLKNTGGRGGGALNAAAFLSEFVGDVPWTHLDIAGTSFAREPKPFRSAGATGVGVGAIASLVLQMTGDTAAHQD